MPTQNEIAPAPAPTPVHLVALYISPGHNFFGRHGLKAGTHSIVEVPEVECVADQGLRGDRFFNHRESYKGQATFFAWEVYSELCVFFGLKDKQPSAFRRNIITRGIDLNGWIGREFEIQGVRFLGTEECKPCAWMNEAFAPGTEKVLQGRGGLRARILNNGTLRSGA